MVYSNFTEAFNNDEVIELDKIAHKMNNKLYYSAQGNITSKQPVNYPPPSEDIGYINEVYPSFEKNDAYPRNERLPVPNPKYEYERAMENELENHPNEYTIENESYSGISKNSFIKDVEDKDIDYHLIPTNKHNYDHRFTFDLNHKNNESDNKSNDSIDHLIEHIKTCKGCKLKLRNDLLQQNSKRHNVYVEGYHNNSSPSSEEQYNYDVTPYTRDFKDIMLVLLIGIGLIFILSSIYYSSL